MKRNQGITILLAGLFCFMAFSAYMTPTDAEVDHILNCSSYRDAGNCKDGAS